jgi:hypothetical protein
VQCRVFKRQLADTFHAANANITVKISPTDRRHDRSQSLAEAES